ncbi:MAG: 23S rRNA (uracil(1939)-C(5))-methyltransferase RlmD [Flavobacteriales bacterium]
MQKERLLKSIEVTDVGAKGKGIARADGQVVMIEGAVPGDVVDAQIIRKKKQYLVARIAEIKKPSVYRVDAFCKHFGLCGGCKWQNMSYDAQLVFKQKQVDDALRKIGHIETNCTLPIIGADETRHYRNQLEFTCSNSRWLTEEEISDGKAHNRNAIGFHLPGRFDRIIDLEECHLQPEPSESIRLAARKYAMENGLEFYDPVKHTGLLRNILIRTASTGEVMVLLVFNHSAPDITEPLLQHLKEQFPAITSLLWLINTKVNDTFYDCPVRVFHGQSHITEQVCGLQFQVDAKSFFQTNTRQAERLYEKTLSFAGLSGEETVYDLYAGTGAITLCAAKHARFVLGIESVPEAVENAVENTHLNGINNAAFICGDIKNELGLHLIKRYGKPDVVITDPPRAGMHKEAIAAMLSLDAQRIVYVSCNPATQARDIALMNPQYAVVKIQPVDMFPHTYHIENIVLLEKTT